LDAVASGPVLLTYHPLHHCPAMSVGTGMGFQLVMPTMNEYYAHKQAQKEIKTQNDINKLKQKLLVLA